MDLDICLCVVLVSWCEDSYSTIVLLKKMQQKKPGYLFVYLQKEVPNIAADLAGLRCISPNLSLNGVMYLVVVVNSWHSGDAGEKTLTPS